MTAELTLLLYSIILSFLLALFPVFLMIPKVGLMPLFGNRENLPDAGEFCSRAKRARDNLYEWLPMFAGLVLIAHLAGVSNANTVLGAELFFYGRLAHAIVYIAGIVYLRTALWAVSAVGLVMIALQLI